MTKDKSEPYFRLWEGNRVRVYLELAKRSFRQVLTYRGATLAGLFTNSIFGVIIASIFLGFYASSGSGDVRGWSAQQTLTFTWINQSLLMVVYMWGWWEIARSIQTGSIVMDFLKPVNFLSYWMSRDLGRAAAHFLVRGLPTFLIGNLLYDLLPPRSFANGAAFLLSIVFAVTVSFTLRFLLNISGFWVIDHRGINYVAMAMLNLLSGLLIPLAFFPDPVLTIVNLLPCRAILMIPNEIYLGQIDIWEGLGVQIFWTLALIAISAWVLSLGERKVVVQRG
ncbi:MAG: ABC transporter permease [Thermomicrobiales bacterium]